MADFGDRGLQSQLDDLRAVVAATKADVSGLQEGARQAEERADASDGRATANSQRIDALEERAETDREMIAALQADGVLSREHAANLENALVSARMIGAAVGIIMAFYGVTESAAFQMLKKTSMDRNVKLRALAEEVVLTGSADGLPPQQ